MNDYERDLFDHLPRPIIALNETRKKEGLAKLGTSNFFLLSGELRS